MLLICANGKWDAICIHVHFVHVSVSLWRVCRYQLNRNAALKGHKKCIRKVKRTFLEYMHRAIFFPTVIFSIKYTYNISLVCIKTHFTYFENFFKQWIYLYACIQYSVPTRFTVKWSYNIKKRELQHLKKRVSRKIGKVKKRQINICTSY
jgi:hypothetical protein